MRRSREGLCDSEHWRWWPPGYSTAQEHEHVNEQQYERYQQPQNRHQAYGFGLGLLTGACVGAGLALWFAPRLASELRERVTDSAKHLGQRVGDRYDQVSVRLAQAADEVTRKGQDVRDNVADAVAHGAREVERYAMAAKMR